MPIEFWWWIKPLFLTGLISTLMFVPLSLWLDTKFNKRWIQIFAYALLIVAVAPVIIGGISAVIWFLANVMIVVWRR